MADNGITAASVKRRGGSRWREYFLEHLAETSNISKSAARAGITTARLYRERRQDPKFARDWLAAHWDKHGTPPRLPDEIVERTAARYRELIARLTT